MIDFCGRSGHSSYFFIYVRDLLCLHYTFCISSLVIIKRMLQHALLVPGKVINLRRGKSTGRSVTIMWNPPQESEDYKTLEYLIRDGIEGSELNTISRQPHTRTNFTLSNLGTIFCVI